MYIYIYPIASVNFVFARKKPLICKACSAYFKIKEMCLSNFYQ